MSTNSPQHRPATIAECLAVLKARHWEIFSPAERRELRDAIIALTVIEPLRSETQRLIKELRDESDFLHRVTQASPKRNLYARAATALEQLERELNAARSAIERMVRHHKLCPAFRGESPCKCDANYAYAKLNEQPRSAIGATSTRSDK